MRILVRAGKRNAPMEKLQDPGPEALKLIENALATALNPMTVRNAGAAHLWRLTFQRLSHGADKTNPIKPETQKLAKIAFNHPNTLKILNELAGTRNTSPLEASQAAGLIALGGSQAITRTLETGHQIPGWHEDLLSTNMFNAALRNGDVATMRTIFRHPLFNADRNRAVRIALHAPLSFAKPEDLEGPVFRLFAETIANGTKNGESDQKITAEWIARQGSQAAAWIHHKQAKTIKRLNSTLEKSGILDSIEISGETIFPAETHQTFPKNPFYSAKMNTAMIAGFIELDLFRHAHGKTLHAVILRSIEHSLNPDNAGDGYDLPWSDPQFHNLVAQWRSAQLKRGVNRETEGNLKNQLRINTAPLHKFGADGAFFNGARIRQINRTCLSTEKSMDATDPTRSGNMKTPCQTEIPERNASKPQHRETPKP